MIWYILHASMGRTSTGWDAKETDVSVDMKSIINGLTHRQDEAYSFQTR